VRIRAVGVGLLLLASAIAVGCKRAPAAGAECSENGALACADRNTMLVCDAFASTGGHYHYTAVRCGGPKGCSGEGNGTRCDFSGNAEGEPCLQELGVHGQPDDMCTDDGKSEIRCQALHGPGWAFHKFACAGPTACVDARGSLRCDDSTSREGTACDRGEGWTVCNADGASVLGCPMDSSHESHWTVVQRCPAGQRCRSDGPGDAKCAGGPK
jgi:hypothetical protein